MISSKSNVFFFVPQLPIVSRLPPREYDNRTMVSDGTNAANVSTVLTFQTTIFRPSRSTSSKPMACPSCSSKHRNHRNSARTPRKPYRGIQTSLSLPTTEPSKPPSSPNAEHDVISKSTTSTCDDINFEGASTVVIMRHGLTDWNAAGRVQGNSDESKLNGIGIEQAIMAGKKLINIPFDAVLMSPLSRARQTFNLLVESSKNSTLTSIDPCVLDVLTEIQFPWQGMQRRDISNSQWSSEYLFYKNHPRQFSHNGLNPIRDIEKRAHVVWQQLKSQMANCSLIIAHNQTNKALVSCGLGIHTDLHWNQANCCINVFSIPKNEEPVLRLFNYVAQPTVSNFIDLKGLNGQLKRQPSNYDNSKNGDNITSDNESSSQTRTEYSIWYKRPLRKNGYTRVFIHHMKKETSSTISNSFDSERAFDLLCSEMKIALVTKIFAVGEDGELALSNHIVENKVLLAYQPSSPRTNLTSWNLQGLYNSNEDEIYNGMRDLLKNIRTHHQNEAVSIITSDRRVVSAAFAVAFKLGVLGMERVHSDPASISIIDIPSKKRLPFDHSSQTSTLECFNIPLSESDDALLNFTKPQRSTEGVPT